MTKRSDLDTLIVTIFCQLDDSLKRLLGTTKLRQRGRLPALSDAEVLTIETVGEFLGLAQEKQIFEYFRRHYRAFFPALETVHRTTFTRQAANLWRVKERLWQAVLPAAKFDAQVSLIDSFPIEICRFARASRCRRLREIAAYGFDEVARQIFFGVRFHLRVCLPGVITGFEFAPANVHELVAAEDLFENVRGFALADRNYWSPAFFAACRHRGLQVIAPFRSAKRETKKFPRSLTNLRRRIETVIGQLSERFSIKRVWAREEWHFCSRLLRKVLAHTIFVGLCQKENCEPLQMARLLSN